jgi:hypothetical protein
MKYAIHHKTWGHVGLDSEFYPDESAATVALMECLRTGELKDNRESYTIEPYDDEGHQLVKVDKDDMKQASADAQDLIHNHKDVSLAVQAMVASRQMYMVAVIELERLIANMDEENKPHPDTIDLLVQSAAHQASVPVGFTEDVLFVGMEKTVMPWLKYMAADHARQDAAEKRKTEEETEKRRRELPIPIGFNVGAYNKNILARQKPVVLVGYWPAVKHLLDMAVNTALTSKDGPQQFQVMRMAKQEKVSEDEAVPGLVISASKLWHNVGSSHSKVRVMFAGANKKLGSLVDLVVCDDLSMVYQEPGLRHVGHCCAEGCKRLMDACKVNGSGLLAGIGWPNQSLPALGEPMWHRLGLHAILRPVRVEDAGKGKKKIIVGKDAFETVVDSKLLDWEGPVLVP